MSKEELKAALPEGWSYSEHNGRVHIKVMTSKKTLDIHGNIVDPKSPDAHILWDK